MIDPGQFRSEIIRPALAALGAPYQSEAAANLLLGTALVESGLRYLVQHGDGPARGVYQIEPASFDDLGTNFLAFRPSLRIALGALSFPGLSRIHQLTGNLTFATAVARLIYWRAPGALPGADDVPGLAAYWKAHYNTALGGGTVEKFIAAYTKAEIRNG